jgi:hypothetical protein
MYLGFALVARCRAGARLAAAPLLLAAAFVVAADRLLIVPEERTAPGAGVG